MLSFQCDYTEGCHEKILEAFASVNREQYSGYGFDPFTESAKNKIRQACQCPDADVFFLSGGTQTNAIAIDSMLRPYEGAISGDTGHINIHEAGAIEFLGHKVLTVPSRDGKISAADVRKLLEDFWADGTYSHMVFPGMVYISQPTELGTLYTADELRSLSSLCLEYKIPLYIDGARLGYGLMADTDVTLPMLAELADLFYIGGTKVGTLNGEALVFTKNNTPDHFDTIIKEHGALLAKGRLVGIQFDTLFTDGLYYELGANGIRRAMELRELFLSRGIELYIDSPTNQQFFLMKNELIHSLRENVMFELWGPEREATTPVRFVTSWATTGEQIRDLEKFLDLALEETGI